MTTTNALTVTQQDAPTTPAVDDGSFAAAFDLALGSPAAAPQAPAPQYAAPTSPSSPVQPSQGVPQGAPANGLGQQAQPHQPGGQPEVALVPSSRVREQTERARAAEERAQAAEMANAQLQGYVKALLANQPQAPQPQPQARPQMPQLPDLIDNPNGFAVGLVNIAEARTEAVARKVIRDELGQASGQMANVKLQVSDMVAAAVYGRDAIKEATTAAVTSGKRDYFMSLPDPVGEAIRWHRSVQAQQQYGADPATVKANVARELINDPAFRQQFLAALQQPQGQPQPIAYAPHGQPQAFVPAPPPLAGAPRAAAGPVPGSALGGMHDALTAMFDQRNRPQQAAR